MDSGYRACTRRIICKYQSIRDDQSDRSDLTDSPTTMTSVSAVQTGTSERELIAAKTTSDDDRWQTTSLTSLTFPSASPVPLTSCQLPRTPRHTTSLQEGPNSLNYLIRVSQIAESFHIVPHKDECESHFNSTSKIVGENESVIIRLTKKYLNVSRSSKAYLNRWNYRHLW